ncbi:hypothetical protein JHK82_024694 [Glycine max]|nr:hypothetical protein JHK85_025296 [Glycine max]KAG5012544.1 hypothetical protein JHK86_024805 [Glycine max]KAG5133506.1 hypothetical protein JHK82_024694 [Glycine max]
MGRRFGDWNNPKLCQQIGLMSSSHVPYESGDNYFPKRFSDFLVYMEWVIVDGETWILETDHE